MNSINTFELTNEELDYLVCVLIDMYNNLNRDEDVYFIEVALVEALIHKFEGGV